MESENKKIIIAAVVMALLTTFLVYSYIKKATVKTEAVDYINVFVASKTLPARYKITDADIKQVKLNKDYLNQKAVLNKSDIIGKRLKDSIIEGEQILRDRLANEGNVTLAYNVPEGKRAVSINVNEQIEVSNLIRPGDFVDIYASFDREEVEKGTEKKIYPRITKQVIQNVEVLSLGQDQIVADEKTKELPKTITLAVSIEDTPKLIYASEYAALRLALRPAGENKKVDTQEITRDDLVSDKNASVAAGNISTAPAITAPAVK